MNSLNEDTRVKRTPSPRPGRIAPYCILCNETPSKVDTSLRRTQRAGPESVRLRGSSV